MVYGIIIAGGRGERFWPKSTKKLPKQLLPIVSDKPMIVETIDRITDLIPKDKIIIVAGENTKKELQNLFPNVKLLLEPFGRNTACAIAYAAITLKEKDVMLVMPADHNIKEKKLFLDTLKVGIEYAKKEYLITFGIVPSRAETQYGYIEIGEKINDIVYKAKSFYEKPNQRQAHEFVKKKIYLWNSGIFVWTVQNILTQIQLYMPEFYRNLMKFKDKKISLIELYERAPDISVDYAIMEKAKNVAVVQSNFIWDDVGNWTALERIYPKDKNGNIKIGKYKGLNTKDCIIYTDSGIITTIGISNLVIIKSNDKVFVGKKSEINEIKKLLSEMEQDKEFEEYL